MEKEEEKTIITTKKSVDHIRINVTNANGNEVFFKTKRTTKLKKLMDAYCKRQGLVPGSVRFTFDGNRINNDNTPDELDMADDDVIDVFTFYNCLINLIYRL